MSITRISRSLARRVPERWRPPHSWVVGHHEPSPHPPRGRAMSPISAVRDRSPWMPRRAVTEEGDEPTESGLAQRHVAPGDGVPHQVGGALHVELGGDAGAVMLHRAIADVE